MPKKNQKFTKAQGFNVSKRTAFAVFLTTLLLLQMVQLVQLRSKLRFIDGLQESQGAVVEQVSLSQNYLSQFASDLNEIRRFLLLPESNYDFSGMEESEPQAETEDLTSEVFDFVQALGEAEADAARFESERQAMSEFLTTERLTAWEQNLEGPTDALENLEWRFIDQKTGKNSLTLSLNYEGEWSGSSYNGKTEWEGESGEDIQEAIQEFYEDRVEMQADLAAMLESERFLSEQLYPYESFQSYLTESGLTLISDETGSQLRTAEGLDVARFEISPEKGTLFLEILRPQEGKDASKSKISLDASGVESALQTLKEEAETRSELALTIETRRRELSQLMQDRGFMSTIEALGLQFGDPVEEETRLVYPISNEAGELLRHLILDLTTGELSVEVPGTGETASLSDATEQLLETGKKKLSTYLV